MRGRKRKASDIEALRRLKHWLGEEIRHQLQNPAQEDQSERDDADSSNGNESEDMFDNESIGNTKEETAEQDDQDGLEGNEDNEAEMTNNGDNQVEMEDNGTALEQSDDNAGTNNNSLANPKAGTSKSNDNIDNIWPDGDSDFEDIDEGDHQNDSHSLPATVAGNLYTFRTSSGRYEVSMLKRNLIKYAKFGLKDQLFDLSLKVLNKDGNENSLLVDCLEILHEAITEALKVLQKTLEPSNFNHQVYLTIVDKELLNRGINTANFSLQENPSLLADILLTKLR